MKNIELKGGIKMKKIILSLLVISVLLVSVGMVVAEKNQQQKQDKKTGLPKNAVEIEPGVFYLGKKIDKGKVVEGYAFVHYDAKNPDRVKKPKPTPTEDDSRVYKLLGVKWFDAIQYEVNTFGSGLDESEVINILSKSLETWDSKTSFELFNDELVSTTETFVEGAEPDFINRIVWKYFGGSGTIAYNAFWYYPVTNEMIESDVVFNSYYDWNIEETCPSNKMDLQNIATHEFGHNGLADLYQRPTRPLTMYGYSTEGEISKRDLATGDILGIQELYGI
ncbi:MAG: matrixin family metalloprotease [archaeon]